MKRDPASFGALIAVTVTVLAALNELPRFLGGEPRGIVRYPSVEALEARHGRVWRPAAMPAPWTWPPTRIRLAVADRWIEFEFESGRDTLAICQTVEDLGRGQALGLAARDERVEERTARSLRLGSGSPEQESRGSGQASSAPADRRSAPVSGGGASSAPTEQDVPDELLPSGQMLQTIDTSMAGRGAQLRRVLLDDGTIVHEMWWREGTTRMMLRLRGSADRLPSVAAALLGQR